MGKKETKYPLGYGQFKTSDLNKCNWNYKGEDKKLTEKLKNNIQSNGQVENLLVYLDENNNYVVLNGNHRLDVLNELGFKEVFCFNFGSISEKKAQRIAIETNETKFKTDNDKLYSLIHDLNQEFGLDSLLETMPYNEEQFEFFEFNYQKANNDPEEQEEVTESITDNQFKKLTLNLTNEVFELWELWKQKVKADTEDPNLSENKMFEFAMAEALNG